MVEPLVDPINAFFWLNDSNVANTAIVYSHHYCVRSAEQAFFYDSGVNSRCHADTVIEKAPKLNQICIDDFCGKTAVHFLSQQICEPVKGLLLIWLRLIYCQKCSDYK